jgi:hypothetical protein
MITDFKFYDSRFQIPSKIVGIVKSEIMESEIMESEI